MSRFRSLLAAAGLLLAAGGCIDDPPSAPGGGDVPLRLQLRLAEAVGDLPLRVRVAFMDDDGESLVDLPVTPPLITVSGGTAERRVGVRLERCFAESPRTRESGTVYCTIAVQVVAPGVGDGEGEGSGDIESELHFVDVDAGDRGPIVVPAFSLGGLTLSGVVRDALDNDPVSGVSVDLYAGTTATGTPLATSTTGSDGVYLFNGVTAGTYTLGARGSGILATTAGPVTVTEASVAADIVVSPVLAPNEVRVVLTWGASPSDLDSHLYGPPSADDYHIFWQLQNAPPYAALDRDDTDASGPETITIQQLAAGSHLYAVHDFTNQLSTTSTALGASGARVQVYRSTGLAADFTVPNVAGTLWTVFSLDGGTITPINRMSFGSPATRPSTSVARRAASSASRAAAAPLVKAPAGAHP